MEQPVGHPSTSPAERRPPEAPEAAPRPAPARAGATKASKAPLRPKPRPAPKRKPAAAPAKAKAPRKASSPAPPGPRAKGGRSRARGATASARPRSVALERVAMPPATFPDAPAQGVAPRLGPPRLGVPADAAPAPAVDGRVRHLLLLSAPFLGFAVASYGFTDRLLAPMLFLEEGFAGLAMASTVALVGFLAFGLAQLAGGAWSDGLRSPYGARWPALLPATAFAAMALGLSLAARGAAGILFSFVLLQAALGVAVAAAQPLLAETVPAPRRGLGAGLRGAGEMGGLLLAGFLAQGVLEAGSAGTPLLAMLLLVLLGTVGCATTLRRLAPPAHAAPLPEGAPEPEAPRLLATLRAPLEPRFARAALGRAGVALGGFLFLYGLDAVLDTRLPATAAAEAEGLLMTGIAFLLVGSLAGGAASDRVGRRGVVQGGVFLGLTGSVLLLVAQRPLEFLVFGALAAGGLGAALAASWALLADLTPPRTGGRYLGLAGLATALAAVGALLVAGGGVPPEGLLLLAAAATGAGWWVLRPVVAPRPPAPAQFQVVRAGAGPAVVSRPIRRA